MKNILIMISVIIIINAIYSIYFQLTEKRPSIYWLNFKPESDKIIKELALEYEEQTGIKVNIMTPESNLYNEVLVREIQKSSPPTLFVIGNLKDVNKFREYFYDLKNTKIVSELNTNDYNLYTEDNKLVAIGYCYETFGLITNIELLEKAGFKIDEINTHLSK